MGDNAEINNVLAALTQILQNQQVQSENRDQQINEVIESQRQLTERIAALTTGATPKKPTNATPAPRLSHNCSLREFSNWKIKLDDYILLNSVNKLELIEQKAVFRSLLDDEWLRIIQFVIDTKIDDEDSDISSIVEAMQTYLRSQRNVVLDRKSFYSRNQHPGEKFDDYYMTLQDIADFCDFCQICIEDQYRDRIITGILDEETVRELLAEENLTLEKAVSICRARENANKDNAELQDSTSDYNYSNVSKISSYRKEKSRNFNKFQQKPDMKICPFCNYNWHEKLSDCPARGRTCLKCGEINHFARSQKCRNSNMSCFSEPKKNSNDKKNMYRLRINDVSTKRAHKGKQSPRIKVNVSYDDNKIQISATPDTGAEISAIPLSEAKRLKINLNDLKPQQNKLYGAGNNELTCYGTFIARLQLGETVVDAELSVVKEIQSFLLSWYHAIDLHILPDCFPQQLPHNNVRQLQKKHQPLINRQLPDIPENHNPTKQEREEHMNYIKSKFPSVFDTSKTLKPMSGGSMQIPLYENATPFSITTARNVPYGWRDKLKKQIDDMVAKEIIVEVTEPTQWCHPIVIQPKKDSDEIRLCVDLTRLNKYVKRATYPVRTAYDAVSNITRGETYFTTLDAKCGYWQIPIADEDQHLTTFITPWGRYKFLRAPMGLLSSGDEYTRRGDGIMNDMEKTIKIVDDILVHDNDYKSHIQKVWKILEACEENSITLNPDKVNFAQEEVSYCGYILNKDGFTVDRRKTDAIRNFPKPTCITDLRSFMGLVNQLTDFSSEIAKKAEPLRHLLKKNTVWMWTTVHDKAFEDMKETLVSPPVLAYFDPNLATMLLTDASKLNGIGFALLQQHDDGWKLVKCGSRFMSDTERRYAIIEQEMLAVVWATKKCQQFLRGAQHYDVIIDHRPLVPILNSKGINEIDNPRLQRLKEKLSQYNFTASWRKGKEHSVPDALSRYPSEYPTHDDEEAENDMEEAVREIIHIAIQTISTSHGNNDSMIESIINAGNADPEYISLRNTIKEKLPEHKNEWKPEIRSYFNVKEKLSIDGDLILCGRRIVIPFKLRKETLEKLHASHQGIERSKQRARQTVYWPNIDHDIANKCRSCKECQKYQPSNQKEPIVHEETPKRVFQSVSADYFQYAGKYYLIYADRLSGYPMVQVFEHEATARTLITTLRYFFSLTGAPETMRCDNGPQFIASKLREFLTRWNVQIKPSTPHYPQSNGHAEATVKAVKHLIAKCNESGNLDTDSFAMGMLELRNTPRKEGRSPAQILFGHPLRSNVPAHHSAFAKEHQEAMEECDRKRMINQEKADLRYNRSAKPLPEFKMGDHVNIQHHKTGLWDKNGIIVGVGKKRDYMIKLNSGRIYWRNRRFIRSHHPMSPRNIVQNQQDSSEVIVTPRRTPSNNLQNPSSPGELHNSVQNQQGQDHHPDVPQPVENLPVKSRKSSRASVRPKRLVLDPAAKTYREDVYVDISDGEDEDIESSS